MAHTNRFSEAELAEILAGLPLFLTIDGLADVFGVSRSTVNRLIARGAIRVVRTHPEAHGHVRIPRNEVARALADHQRVRAERTEGVDSDA